MALNLWEWRTCRFSFSIARGITFQAGQKYCIYRMTYPEDVMLFVGSGGGTPVPSELFDPY